MGFLGKLRRGSLSGGKKSLEERSPRRELSLDDVVSHALEPVKIGRVSVAKTRQGLGSRRDRRRRQLERGFTKADRRMCEKMKRRDKRKGRWSRQKKMAAAAGAGK